MADIGDVYGKDYSQQSRLGRMRHSVKLIGNNIAHRKLSFRHDSGFMWQGQNMQREAIVGLIQQVQSVNPQLRLTHVAKTSDKVNMFPFLVNGPVEYFVLTDLTGKEVKLFSLYVSPSIMEAF